MTFPDANSLPLPVFTADANGTITHVNAAWRKVFSVGVGDQWLIVRNARGAEMVGALGDRVVLKALTSGG